MTDSLAQCRADIDAIDDAMVALLARRFRVVDRVIAVKRADNLPAVIPERIEEVISRVHRAAATAGVLPDTIEKLWRLLIAETIAYERGNAVR